jgi:hypothetical protein
MFQAKEAVRLVLDRTAASVACPALSARAVWQGGRFIVCPVCFNAKQFDKDGLSAPIAATTPAGSGSGGVCIWKAGGRSALMRELARGTKSGGEVSANCHILSGMCSSC